MDEEKIELSAERALEIFVESSKWLKKRAGLEKCDCNNCQLCAYNRLYLLVYGKEVELPVIEEAQDDTKEEESAESEETESEEAVSESN